jgi:DNA mismatch repair protein MutS
LEDIAIRQTLLKTFIQKWSILEGFSYSNFDMKEVMEFTRSQKRYQLNGFGDTYKFMFKKERFGIKAKCIQTIAFLNNLNLNHFSRHTDFSFPECLQNKIDSIKKFFLDLKIDQNYKDIERGKFAISNTIAFLDALGEIQEDIDNFWVSLFEYEMYWSIAKGINLNSFTFPVFDNDDFSIAEFYHPLIKNAVKNSLTVNRNIILLTGPNMAGKSTVLKSISLCVFLSHIGLAVPAQSCKMPFYDSFLFSINVNDDIKNGYSSFMNEIMTLKNIIIDLKNGKRCFALFDELFKGTNIDDSLELMIITINGLQQFDNSLFLISTHLYHTQLKVADNKFDAYQLEAMIEDGMPRHTFRLKKGWSNLRFGKLIFDREGLTSLFD